MFWGQIFNLKKNHWPAFSAYEFAMNSTQAEYTSNEG